MIPLCLLAAVVSTPVRVVVGLSGGDLRATTRTPEVRALLATTRGVLVRRLPFALVLDLEPSMLSALARRPDIAWVEPDDAIRVALRALPDDPRFPEQWALRGGSDAAMDLPAAWDLARGLDANGVPVTVAVIDDGFDLDHPDLAANLAHEGYDLSQLPADADPSHGPHDAHGTQTAGVVAARGFNGLGVAGVCPACRILPIRLVGDGGPPDLFTSGSAIAEALVWAVDHGAAVINNSWGPADGNPYDPFHPSELWEEPAVVAAAIRYAATEGRAGLGTLVVWSAGNGGELMTYDRFASDPRVLAVGSVDASGRLAWYSDFGPGVRLVAPSSGDDTMAQILTTDLTGAAGAADGDYSETYGGTSASAAMASGVAALVLSRVPTLTLAQLTEALLASAFPIDAARSPYDDGVSRLYGYGRLDPAAALSVAGSYRGEHSAWLEICDNGRDDNGDGVVDDPEACAPCVPDYPTELCDGRDNNCDGQVDEAFVCTPTNRPVCAPCTDDRQCAAELRCRAATAFPGAWCFALCDADHGCPPGFACAGGACVLIPDATRRTCIDAFVCHEAERCDGIDNDCNGLTDDVAPTSLEAIVAGRACGETGVCADGRAICAAGRFQCARPESWEAVESRCDGLDNDCDGEVDETYVCAARTARLAPEPAPWSCAANPAVAPLVGLCCWLRAKKRVATSEK